MISKAIDTSVPIHDLLARRYSGVSFDPARDVNHDQLLALAEAGRWAPSCFGDQPWRFIFCSRTRHPDAWEKAFACLSEGNQAWCRHAPVLLISCSDTLFERNDKPNAWGPYDTGAAALSICLQAASLDLMSHQMAGFNADEARRLFAIPERFVPLAMMAVGYQLPETDLSEQFKTRELSSRKRSALATRFFGGAWETGL